MLATGLTVDLSDNSTGASIQEGVLKFFQFAAINVLWKEQNAFIARLPIVSQQSALTYPWSSCNGQGMIPLIADVTKALTDSSNAPKGASSPVNLPGVTLTWSDIMASSVGGWQHQGFQANWTNPLYQAIAARVSAPGLTWADLQTMESVSSLAATTEGMLNIPVCQMLDLRYLIG